MNYDAYVAELIKNPKYDSDWVNIAAKIMSEYMEYSEGLVTEEVLAKFTDEQLNVIYNALKNYGDHNPSPDIGYIRTLMDPELNATQMNLIDTVRNKDDRIIYKFMNPKISYSKLSFIAQAWLDCEYDMIEEYGIDAIYEMTIDQVYELYAAKKSNVDISNYKKKDGSLLPADKMAIIRHALELGLNVNYIEETDSITIS